MADRIDMTRIKITSNPYEKKIEYSFWDNWAECWSLIDYANNKDSQLISEELTTGFFPFKANVILDVIFKEFHNEKLELTFAGTEDEYNVLKEVCKNEKFSSISLIRAPESLENARDILPEIVDIFNEVKPLITDSVKDQSKIATDLEKFSEASNETIPICVVGNVSAGKSSFINALIGHEILPSGDEPLTARIYKISPSHFDDRGKIRFHYQDHEVVVRFRGNNQGVTSDLGDHPLIQRIEEVIKPLDVFDLVKSVNRTLITINNFENEELEANVSDLIEIEVPFDSTMYGRGKTDFVIFDTPGSNTASNERHIRVLKEAMQNMSNGLPIFVTEFNSLDSMDNEKLCKDIEALEELDSRFTMVVVNKSDKANLPLDGFSQTDEDKILSMAIPKNLYSGGIFFVSSVIGLGAKTKGEFDNEFYGEIFDDTAPRFEDPNHKRYKRLYMYNIMPEQLKKEAVEESEDCENLLLANSGIYCVEQEINSFAAVYSGYNKCIQSELFLSKVHDITSAEISKAVDERVKSMEYRSSMLEKDKQDLVKALERTTENQRSSSINDYKTFMKSVINEMDFKINSDELKAAEVVLKEKYKEIVSNAGNSTTNDLSTDVLLDIVPSEKKATTLRQLTQNFDNWRRKVAKENEIEQKVRNQAVSELFGGVKEKYKQSNDEIHNILMEKSIEFWNNTIEKTRKELVDLVTNSQALDDEKKTALESLILSYEAMKFNEDSEIRLDQNKFEMKLLSVFVFDPLNINRHKLCRAYNSEIDNSKAGNTRNITVSHIRNYSGWLQALKEMLVNNIIDFNPTLAAQSEIIKEETNRIQDLEAKQRKLDYYVNQIHGMMQWADS